MQEAGLIPNKINRKSFGPTEKQVIRRESGGLMTGTLIGMYNLIQAVFPPTFLVFWQGAQHG